METIKKGKFIYLFFYLECIAYLVKYHIKVIMYLLRRMWRLLLFFYVFYLNIMAQEITCTMEMIVQVSCFAIIHISYKSKTSLHQLCLLQLIYSPSISSEELVDLK